MSAQFSAHQAKYNPRKLVSQYFAQRVPQDRWSQMTSCLGITFRPGGFRDSFRERSILPAGTAVMFQLGYEIASDTKRGPSLRLPLSGIRGQDQPTGSVRYERAGECIRVDLSRRPRPGQRGPVIDPERNPSLLETALRIDKECQRAVDQGRQLASSFTQPRVLLGFTKDRLPAFRDTPALRKLAARQLGIPVRKLGANGELLLERLLRETWEQSVIQPTDPRNWTGTNLVDASLCPVPQGFLRIYEDFRDLLGVPVWNPAREFEVERFVNPAADLLEGVGLGRNPDFNQPIPDELVAYLLAEMRSRQAAVGASFTDEDLLDGLTNPSMPLIAWGELLPRLRANLAVFASECSTDDDLKSAVLHPSDPLWVRYACRVQVVRMAESEGAQPNSCSGFVASGLENLSPLDKIDLADVAA